MTAIPTIDAASFAALARTKLDAAPADGDAQESGSDFRLGPGESASGVVPPEILATARPAAVLIPVIAHPEGATMILTQRASGLRDHGGQIAFPGGKIDPEDSSVLDAALREAEEEIGLDRRHVEPLGYLGPYFSGTGFRITAAVGLVEPGFSLRINHREVDDAFEVPLGFLMEPNNHQRHSREWRGTLRHYYAMPFQERFIWGATAGIIRRLYERIYGL